MGRSKQCENKPNVLALLLSLKNKNKITLTKRFLIEKAYSFSF